MKPPWQRGGLERHVNLSRTHLRKNLELEQVNSRSEAQDNARQMEMESSIRSLTKSMEDQGQESARFMNQTHDTSRGLYSASQLNLDCSMGKVHRFSTPVSEKVPFIQ